jgi:hypothetical protein
MEKLIVVQLFRNSPYFMKHMFINIFAIACILSQMNPIRIPRDLFLAHSLPKKEIMGGLTACMSRV